MQLFRIDEVTRDGNYYEYRAKIDKTSKIFEGHFPENPVVPGVCTLSMVKSCCGSILGRDISFDYIKEVKFLSAILPSVHEELRVEITLKSDDTEAVVVVYAEKVVMMKLKAIIK